MNIEDFFKILVLIIAKYYPEEVDPWMKPIDSSDCLICQQQIYDFIVVGAGTAGCVVANRLSENPNWKVLLIEAGGDEDYLTRIIPLLPTYFAGTKYVWNFTTVPQKNICPNCIYSFAGGHLMGGSSGINGAVYVRGNPNDYNEWEKLGNPGWSYKDILPYFIKMEDIKIPELMTSPYHSTGGPLSVDYGRYTSRFGKDFLKAGVEYGLPVTDYNGVNQYGISFPQSTIKEGTRFSSSRAYIEPIRFRKNLYIFKNSLVTKILFSNATNQGTKVIGVTYTRAGKEYSVYAKKEVIVSAGAINTAKLLMLSGVGPKEDLDKFSIPVYADLPVGRHSKDHTTSMITFDINDTDLIYTPEQVIRAIKEYAKYKRGALAAPIHRAVMFLNSTSDIIDVEVEIIPYMSGMPFDIPPVLLIILANLKPKSTGTVKLKSANYSDQPEIDLNIYGDKSDILPIKWGFQQLLRLMNQPSLSKYSIKLNKEYSKCNYKEPPTDKMLECILNTIMVAGYHTCCTAKMGSPNDNTTVVDPALRVHGITNLRVVDGSIMPVIPSGHTSVPIMMIAEKVSDMIKSDYYYH